MKKTGKITFRATEELKTRISQYAKLKGVSAGKLIHDWIKILLENQLT